MRVDYIDYSTHRAGAERGVRAIESAYSVEAYIKQIEQFLHEGMVIWDSPNSKEAQELRKRIGTNSIIVRIYACVGNVNRVSKWAFEHLPKYAENQNQALERTKKILQYKNGLGYAPWRLSGLITTVYKTLKKSQEDLNVL